MKGNLLFNWRRTARATSSGTTASAERAQSDVMAAASDNGFIPIGVFACAPDGGLALNAGPTVATPPRPAAQVRAAVDKRVGLISRLTWQTGPACGVDAFAEMNRALQRVLNGVEGEIGDSAIAAGTKVYLACRPVGMRYGFDGLAAQVARFLAAD